MGLWKTIKRKMFYRKPRELKEGDPLLEKKSQLSKLYKNSFPKDEREPFSVLKEYVEKQAEEDFDFTGYNYHILVDEKRFTPWQMIKRAFSRKQRGKLKRELAGFASSDYLGSWYDDATEKATGAIGPVGFLHYLAVGKKNKGLGIGTSLLNSTLESLDSDAKGDGYKSVGNVFVEAEDEQLRFFAGAKLKNSYRATQPVYKGELLEYRQRPVNEKEFRKLSEEEREELDAYELNPVIITNSPTGEMSVPVYKSLIARVVFDAQAEDVFKDGHDYWEREPKAGDLKKMHSYKASVKQLKDAGEPVYMAPIDV